GDFWSIAAAAVACFAPLIAFIQDPLSRLEALDFGFLTLLLAVAGLIGLTAMRRGKTGENKTDAIVVGATLFLVCLAEWRWCYEVFYAPGLNGSPLLVVDRLAMVAAWHVAIFLIFAA